MTHTFRFHARGSAFQPRATGLTFVESFEPGSVATFGGNRGTVVPYGSAMYAVPDLQPAERQSDLSAVFIHLQSILPSLRKAGATEFILHMHRVFPSQCNEEFTREEIRLLASLDCHLFYVARHSDERET
jgi:hypothetical protein